MMFWFPRRSFKSDRGDIWRTRSRLSFIPHDSVMGSGQQTVLKEIRMGKGSITLGMVRLSAREGAAREAALPGFFGSLRLEPACHNWPCEDSRHVPNHDHGGKGAFYTVHAGWEPKAGAKGCQAFSDRPWAHKISKGECGSRRESELEWRDNHWRLKARQLSWSGFFLTRSWDKNLRASHVRWRREASQYRTRHQASLPVGNWNLITLKKWERRCRTHFRRIQLRRGEAGLSMQHLPLMAAEDRHRGH